MKLPILLTASLLIFTLHNTAQISNDSLILYMPMNGDAQDYSGNENHGIVHNAMPDTNRFGDMNASYMFNGVDSYIEIPASPMMNMIQTVDEISISAWININQWCISGNVFSIFERYNPNTDSGWLLEANWVAGGLLFLADENDPNNWIGCSNMLEFDQWYHLAFTYSHAQQEAKFYVNGVNVCTSTYGPEINVADTTSSFIIGRSLGGPDEYSDGHIDDYKVYYRAGSSEEVAGEFALGHSEIAVSPEFQVYTNPAKNKLNLRTLSAHRNQSYTLYDLTGNKVKSGMLLTSMATIDIQDLSPGIYMIGMDGCPETLTKVLVEWGN
jgi:hypothetical protein